MLLGVTAGVATQAVGALLLLGLRGRAGRGRQRLTARPFAAVWLSAGIAVASMWIGLTLAYLAPRVPPSFGILAVATATYLGRRSPPRRGRRPPAGRTGAGRPAVRCRSRGPTGSGPTGPDPVRWPG